jgi:hypothetical protein
MTAKTKEGVRKRWDDSKTEVFAKVAMTAGEGGVFEGWDDGKFKEECLKAQDGVSVEAFFR